MYSAFLNQAQGLSQTPFNPAMLGSVAPLSAAQQQAGTMLENNIPGAVSHLMDVGTNLGNFDPAQVRAIESPYTEDVVNATQNWFNNQNAIQGTGLLSQAIRSGNAFGGDRAGIAEAQLAGQQQLAQAPIIAGLRQSGYTQALDEYNRLKAFGLQGAQTALGAPIMGAGALMGWGTIEQQQAQKELDVAQQNAMMQSAYPFQTANWYGSVLGGIGPLTGSQALGFNTPPAPNQLSQGLGIASAAIGLGGSLFGKRGGSVTPRGMGWRNPSWDHPNIGLVDGIRRRARGGGLTATTLDQLPPDMPSQEPRTQLAGDVLYLPIPTGPSAPQAGRPTVEERFEGRAQQLPLILPSGTRLDRGAPLYQGYSPGPRGYQEGGPIYSIPDQDPDALYGRRRREDDDDRDRRRDDEDRYERVPDIAGRLRLSPQRLPQPIVPQAAQAPQDNTVAQGINLLSSGIGLATKLAPLALLAVKHGGAIAGLQSGGSSRKMPSAPSVYQVPSIFGQLELPARQLPQPILPTTGSQPQQNTLAQGLQGLTKSIGGLKSSRSSDGEPIRVGESVSVPADTSSQTDWPTNEARGGLVRRYQDGGGDDDEGPATGSPAGPLQQADEVRYGEVLPPERAPPYRGPTLERYIATEGPRWFTGPPRGSPGGLPVQAREAPNLMLTRERFQRALEDNPQLRRQMDVTTTAEVGTQPGPRAFFQGLTMDRAAARRLPLMYTLRDPAYYPRSTLLATRGTDQGVSPSLFAGANPANFATGNSSFDPRTGRWVGFAGGPQTGSIMTSSGRELGGVEGRDLPYAREMGYRGPSRTAIGPTGPTATGGPSPSGETQQAYTGAPDDTTVDPSTGRPPVGGPSRGGGYRPPRPGETGTIPGAPDPTARTFAQRWATNPFTTLGAGLLAGRSPYFGVNLGQAMLGTTAGVEAQRRQDLLEQKPEMITLPSGEVAWRVGNKLTNMGLSSKERREQEEHEYRMAKPIEGPPEDTGGLIPTPTYFRYNPQTGQIERWTPPPAAGQTPSLQQTQPPTPETPAPATPPPTPAPPAPVAGAPAPAAPAAPSRGLAADLTRPQEERIRAGEAAEAGAPPAEKPPPAATAPSAGAPQAPAAPVIAINQPKERTLQDIEGDWKSGRVAPAGTITDPDALARSRNPAALQGLSPQQADIVKGLADYRIDPKSLKQTMRVGKQEFPWRAALLDRAGAYDSNFREDGFANHKRINNAYNIDGVIARNTISQDMAIQHIGRALDNTDKLNNAKAQWINEFKAYITGKLPSDKLRDPAYRQALSAMKVDVEAVGTELMKVYRGGVGQGSEREIERIMSTLSEFQSPDQLRAALKEATQLLYGRIEATATAYNNAMGPGWERPPTSWMSPRSRDTLVRVYNMDPATGRSGGEAPAAPAGRGGGWQRDPTTGNYRGPDGRIYDPQGKPMQ